MKKRIKPAGDCSYSELPRLRDGKPKKRDLALWLIRTLSEWASKK